MAPEVKCLELVTRNLGYKQVQIHTHVKKKHENICLLRYFPCVQGHSKPNILEERNT